MPDVTSPTLVSYSIPTTIDVRSSAATILVSAAASDNESGVKQVVLWLDHSLTTEIGTFNLIGLFGSSDSWSDGASSQSMTVSQFNAPGVYKIDHADVTDFAGNVHTYTTSQLQSLGLQTSFTIQSQGADVTPPDLRSLSITPSIDVSKGVATFNVTATASDAGSGVKQVVLWLDHSLTTEIGTFNLIGLFGSSDSWSDGASSQSMTVSQFNAPGVYKIDHADVTDVAGNVHTYTTSQLQSLGLQTSFTIQSQGADVTPPDLRSLSITPSIDVSKGVATFNVTATTSDAGSGVKQVVLWLDQSLTTEIGTFNLIGLFGSSDSWSDGASSQSMTVSQFNAPGVYKIDHADVTDFAGNVHTYTTSQLQSLGLQTSFTIQSQRADVTPIVPKISGTSANDKIFPSTDVAEIDGGIGLDTLMLATSHVGFAVQLSSPLVVTQAGAAIKYTLSSVERLQFSDAVVALDIDGNAGQAYRMYQAAFARTPDKDGVSFWVSQVDKGISLHDMATAFIGSNEFKGIYGANPSVQTLVSGFYTNVLGRAPDASGLSFWVGQVQSGLSTADMLVSFSESGENKAHVAPAIQNGIELSLSFFA